MSESKTILGYLALFDPAHLCQDGTYWTWRHASLPISLLDQFYFEIAAKHWPDDGQDFQNNSLLGGFASVGQHWVCWYRWADGGRDKAARPGRRVLAAVFMLAQDHRGYDASGVIESQVVNTIVEQSLGMCPVPQPFSFELACTAPTCVPCGIAIQQISSADQVEIKGARDLSACAAIFESLPENWFLECSFRHDGVTARIQIIARPPQAFTKDLFAGIAPPLDATTASSRSNRHTFLWWAVIVVLLMAAAVALVAVDRTWFFAAEQESIVPTKPGSGRPSGSNAHGETNASSSQVALPPALGDRATCERPLVDCRNPPALEKLASAIQLTSAGLKRLGLVVQQSKSLGARSAAGIASV